MGKFFSILLATVILSTIPYFSNHFVYSSPSVQVNPTCGPSNPGFNIMISANGFAPNSNVNWKLIDSNSGIPLYGYFQTNAAGGFNDVTFADDLRPDHYKMAFGTDDNLDNKFDVGAPIVFANIDIPCPGTQQQSAVQQQSIGINWLDLCRNPIIDAVVSEPCETLTSPDGYTLTQEGKRVVACFLGAGLLMAADPSGKALAEAQSLASVAGLCG